MIKTETLEKTADEYKTPLFVFDEDEVKDRAEKIRDTLNERNSGNPIKLCYSIKANPFLIPALKDVVDSFEVCSPGELEICRESGIPGEMIVYSGVHKELEDTTEAVRYGASVLTAESVHQYEIICEASEKTGQSVSVILRLNSESQFGMSITDIGSILEDSAQHKGVRIIGLHYFAGTQRAKIKRQREELTKLKETMSRLEDSYGVKLSWLEYGPGFAFPYFEGEDDSDTLAPAKELSSDIQALAGVYDVTVEMGRFIASSCGYYLTRISDLKSVDEHNWCIVDGGINHVNYIGSMMGLKIPRIIHVPSKDSHGEKNECTPQKYTLCGSLCTTADVLVRDFEMNSPLLGDILIFCNIGAYSVTEGIYLFLGRDMPKVILNRSGQMVLVRDTINTWRLNMGKEN